MLKYRNLALVATLPIVLLQGCGGGGSSSDTPTSTTPTDNVTWKFRDFSVPASSFANKCSIARTGIDPYTGKSTQMKLVQRCTRKCSCVHSAMTPTFGMTKFRITIQVSIRQFSLTSILL